MQVKVLGTVSPYCHDEKKCPGFLVTTAKEKIILDCGPGITSHLNMKNDLKDLVVVISHYHSDHYADLLSLALSSYVYHNLGYIDKKIIIYLPKPDEQTEPYYQFLTNLGGLNYWEIKTYDATTKIKQNETTISFAENPHDIPSYSIKVQGEGKTLVYSGDTGYQKNSLETFAQNSTLLICEATFLRNQPKKKDFHLYAHEAATIAQKANVKELLLTHFWPEIPKEEYVTEAKEIFPNTSAAIEGKKLTLKL